MDQPIDLNGLIQAAFVSTYGWIKNACDDLMCMSTQRPRTVMLENSPTPWCCDYELVPHIEKSSRLLKKSVPGASRIAVSISNAHVLMKCNLRGHDHAFPEPIPDNPRTYPGSAGSAGCGPSGRVLW